MPVPWPAVVSRAILTGHPSVLSMMIFSEFIIFLIPASSPTPRCVPGCIIMHGMERVLHRFISSMSAFIDFVLRELLADARFMRYALWARILKILLFFKRLSFPLVCIFCKELDCCAGKLDSSFYCLINTACNRHMRTEKYGIHHLLLILKIMASSRSKISHMQGAEERAAEHTVLGM